MYVFAIPPAVCVNVMSFRLELNGLPIDLLVRERQQL